MTDASGLITVACQNHHQILVNGLWACLMSSRGVDVDVQWSGRAVRAHRLLLDLFLSPDKLNLNAMQQLGWHQQHFRPQQQQQPSALNASLDSLLEFVYRGQVSLPREHLPDLLELAKLSDCHMLVEAVHLAANSALHTNSQHQFQEAGVSSLAVAPEVSGTSNEQTRDHAALYPDTRAEHQPVTSGAAKVAEEARATAASTTERKAGSAGTRHKCEECGKTFATLYVLRSHSLLHQTDAKPFKCEQCDKSYLQSKSLVQHMRVHSGERPFQCQQCSKSFALASAYAVHIKSHHGGIRSHCCTECPKKFASRKALQYHLHVHRGEKPYKCQVCGKGFAGNWALQTHSLMHSAERKFKCGVAECGAQFKHWQELRDHKLTHLRGSTFAYECEQCGKGFLRAAGKRRHDLRADCKKEKKPTAASQKLKALRAILAREEATSTATDTATEVAKCSFKCVACGQEFGRVVQLYRHMNAQHPSEPDDVGGDNPAPRVFACTACPLTFGRQEFLDIHASTHVRRGEPKE